ncbi:MAG: hypothetical protein IPJ00_11050 [Saprospirales bacterium]|nr:hypothetical protein [Saprospirales bacterium]
MFPWIGSSVTPILNWIKMIRHIQQVTKMSPKDREHVFAMLDAFIKQTMSETVLQ